MKTYFIVNSIEAKYIVWGDSSQPHEEAVPVVIFPPSISDTLVSDVLSTLTTNPAYANEGTAVEELVAESLQEMSEELDEDTITKEILGS